MEATEYKNGVCPVGFTVGMVAGKWKFLIIWLLSQKTRRFNELHREMPGISQAILTTQLRELERDGLIHREVYKEVPPKVEYSLTEIALEFIPIIIQMGEFGKKYMAYKDKSANNKNVEY